MLCFLIWLKASMVALPPGPGRNPGKDQGIFSNPREAFNSSGFLSCSTVASTASTFRFPTIWMFLVDPNFGHLARCLSEVVRISRPLGRRSFRANGDPERRLNVRSDKRALITKAGTPLSLA